MGPVLTQAFMIWGGQTNIVDWGKVIIPETETGGIKGSVYYGNTRAENVARFFVAELWDPGIPRVQIALYQDSDYDGVIDDLNHDGGPTQADVDNWPFGWRQSPAAKGPEDVDRNANGTFDPGDALNITTTDSWDDNPPDGVGPAQVVNGHTIASGAETLRSWNQVRPGLADGTYGTDSYFPNGMASGSTERQGLPSTYYIVQASPPPGYLIQKDQDKNVDFGDSYYPNALLPVIGPPTCVGDGYTVPAEFSLFPGIPTPLAGTTDHLCDVREIHLANTENGAIDFSMFTEVPKAVRAHGFVTNDLNLEFNPLSPNLGSNLAPAWMPISMKEYDGTEVYRTYTDEWGKFDSLAPGSFSANIPLPTGFSPSMIIVFPNDPGMKPDPAHPGHFMLDPWFNPVYDVSWFAPFDFFPGKTQDADMPILPIGAMTANRTPLDCDFLDGTPTVYMVDSADGGPYLASGVGQLTISSRGAVVVPNPSFDPLYPVGSATVERDYGFGATPGTVDIAGNTLHVDSWTGNTILATVKPSAVTGQLTVKRGDNNKTSILGITVHLGSANYSEVIHLAAGQSIQSAINAASDNALILVPPGVYGETPVMYKPVKLQGYGAYATIIEPLQVIMSMSAQATWNALMTALIASGDVVLPPGTPADLPTWAGVNPFGSEHLAGITINSSPGRFAAVSVPALVDGFFITGALDTGGGILVMAYANNLHISNNKLIGNQGFVGGGIRVGTPSLMDPTGLLFVSSVNPGLVIHNNHVAQNGSVWGGGGGLAIYKGADNCLVASNFICGNYAINYGGGIQQLGLSNNTDYEGNWIVANESGDEGAGVALVGELVPFGSPAGTLTEGVGSVKLNGNLIQGNKAGDDGGGVLALLFSGQDVADNPGNMNNWHTLDLFNNMIVNNTSADAGAGIALDDAVPVNIINNTIARNDATGTGSDNFGGFSFAINTPAALTALLPPGGGQLGSLTSSTPVVAGILSLAFSADLQTALGAAGYTTTYSNPLLQDNNIYQNRSFFWDATYAGGTGSLRPNIAGGEAPVFWDLDVMNTSSYQKLNPMHGVLTSLMAPIAGGGSAAYDASNTTGNPNFVASYYNVYEATSTGAALGNFVTTAFMPTGQIGDYHISAGSSAIGHGAGLYWAVFPDLQSDYDGDARPAATPDAGADQLP